MFQNILRSLSGSFAELGRWEPTADRSEVALRNGLEKSILFVLCSSAIMGISALTLPVSGSGLDHAWAVSALSFAALMISYYIASSKRFYDIAILSCICDPISIAVEGVAERLPEPPRVRIPECVPSLEECVAKLPTYDTTRSVVKRIVETITPVSLPQKIHALLETRVY
ncbi:uncharacterized protein EMH_0033160 [Eimeria mitis]|uniref:Uncharacterized protein n=1 Tax=Eimeria mitis TaxID=44415 RepID=U6JQ56_9EIME|nr:uncharacterized protein EMH_0033160 [Eimeria mitis]CDJ27594.1 hypothetical protein, conserved [Eimeria mitis]